MKTDLLNESTDYVIEAVMTDAEIKHIETEFREEQKVKKLADYPKTISVKFRTERDADDFCRTIECDIEYSEKVLIYKKGRTKNHGKSQFKGSKGLKKATSRSDDWKQHWVDMPTYEQNQKLWEFHKIKVTCPTRDDYADLANTLRQRLTLKTKSIYHPSWSPAKLANRRWVSSSPFKETAPRYPIYIVSRGRAYSRHTSKTLENMNVPYFIVVEKAEYEVYASVIDEKKILTLPYDTDPNNPTGPGRARNWCWDHATQVLKTKRHWVMDDNLDGFYRLNKNQRIKVADGAIFRVMEDFVDRYSNIRVAGPTYRFFAPPKSELPAFVANTRIYSCLLIDNECEHRWRERYNEDTILSLDVLTDGDCTVQFNAFLQGKMGTQVLKGGNTETFYHAEGEDFDEDNYNPTGTTAKSLNLVKIYPKYCSIETRARRIHHYVDYSSFKANKLILKENHDTPTDPEYGMALKDI